MDDEKGAKERYFCSQCGVEIEKGWVKEDDFDNEDEYWIALWMCKDCFVEYRSHNLIDQYIGEST